MIFFFYFFFKQKESRETICPIPNILNIKKDSTKKTGGTSTWPSKPHKNVANKDKTIKINYKVVMEPTLKGKEKPKHTQTYQTLPSEPAYGRETE
jgi:hypothetical protein